MTAPPIFIGVAGTMDEALSTRYDAPRRNAGILVIRNSCLKPSVRGIAGSNDIFDNKHRTKRIVFLSNPHNPYPRKMPSASRGKKPRLNKFQRRKER
jgi:hypothetical protein